MAFINLADPIVQSVRSHTYICFIHDIYMFYAFCIEGNCFQPVCNCLCLWCMLMTYFLDKYWSQPVFFKYFYSWSSCMQ